MDFGSFKKKNKIFHAKKCNDPNAMTLLRLI